MSVRIHTTAEVSAQAKIGEGSAIWNHVQVREDASLGENCILSKGVYIDAGVSIGNNVKIQNYVSVYHGVTIEDGVFVGPHVCFTNDLRPRAINPDGSLKSADDWVLSKTLIKRGAAIGANSTIVCGTTIGEWAIIGSGSVVSKDVPNYGLAWGNPARLHGFVCPCGERLEKKAQNNSYITAVCQKCSQTIQIPIQDVAKGILFSDMGENKMISIAKPLIGPEEKQAVLEVLDSGVIAQGPRVKAFEDAFAKMCGVEHAIATTSGTTALHTSLLAHNIGDGDEVITSPFTFIASANSVLFVGAKPVFVDIDPISYNINPALIEAAITPHTKAIMPVHLFGLSCDMDAILAIAGKHNLVIVEDACQSHGAIYKGKRVGSFGTGTFSLYPTKNITSAEGGMITTNDVKIADECRIIRQHGMKRRYYHDELGFNFRMTDVHAAIGLAQLGKLEQFNQARQRNAQYFNAHLKGVILPTIPAGYEHVFHQYTIRVLNGKRDALEKHLNEKGIGTGVYYPVPIHKQTYYVQKLNYNQTVPEAEKAAAEVLSLPIHPALSQADLETIVQAINEFTA